MKKISLLIVSVFAVIISCFFVAGCANPDPVGTWKFKVMTADAGGIKMKYEAGKTYMYGQLSFTEDSMVLEVYEDNTWTASMDMLDESGTDSGTWEVKNGKVYLYDSNGKTQTATIKDNELTMSRKENGTDYQIVLVLQTAE